MRAALEELKSIRLLIALCGIWSIACFTVIRFSSLMRCANFKRSAGLPLEVVGQSYGALSSVLGFPLTVHPNPSLDATANYPISFVRDVALNSFLLSVVMTFILMVVLFVYGYYMGKLNCRFMHWVESRPKPGTY